MNLWGAPWCRGTLGGAAEASGRARGELHGAPRSRSQFQEAPQKALRNDPWLARNLEATKGAPLKNIHFYTLIGLSAPIGRLQGRPGNLCEPPRAAQKPLMTLLDWDQRYKKPSKQSKNPKMPRDHQMETKRNLSATRFPKRDHLTPHIEPLRRPLAPRDPRRSCGGVRKGQRRAPWSSMKPSSGPRSTPKGREERPMACQNPRSYKVGSA